MQLKSFLSNRYRIISSVAVALAIILTAHTLAAPKAFRLGLQLADGTYCSTQKGEYKFTGTSNITASGLIPSLWATDTGGDNPDCMNLNLEVASQTFSSDFRICLQFADSVGLNFDGTVRTLDQVGAMKCTPWASENGGWSPVATDANGYDWDTAQVAIETRAMPAGAVEITDYRIGGRLCDDGCSAQFGTIQFTPWASANGGKSAWFSDENWFNSDGGQLALEVVRASPPAGNTCTTAVSAADQPLINLSRIVYVNAVRSGLTTCPDGTLFVGTDQQDHAGAVRMICAEAKNILVAGATPTEVELREERTGNVSNFYACPAGAIVIGFRQDGDGRETAIRCQTAKPGSIQFLSGAQQSGILAPAHGQPGDRYEVSFKGAKAGEWVAIGAYYNADPRSSRGISGYPLGKRTDLSATPVPCSCTTRQERQPVPDSEQPIVRQGERTVLGIDGTGTGWKTCPSDSIWTNTHLHNNNDDRKEHYAHCTDTERMVDLNFRYTTAGGTVLPAGQARPVYPAGDDAYCAADEVMVGALYYDDDATGNRDEGIRAIHCRKLVAGVTIDRNQIVVFPNAGCGQTFCDAYSGTYGALNNAKAADGRPLVPIGMNIRPGDSNKYARGIWAAPLNKIADRLITIQPGPECSACVAGGRDLTQPLSTSPATAVMGGNGSQVIGAECTGAKLPIAVATEFANFKKIVAGTCVATTPGFFTTGATTFITTSVAYNGTYSCPAGSVITRFVDGGILCKPIVGGADGLLMATARKVAIGAGTAVNNYFSLAQNNSTKIWAPVAVEYQGGVPAQKSITVVEVRTAPSCTQLPPPVSGAIRVHRMVRTAEGTPGLPAFGTKAGINQTNMVSDQPAVFLQLGVGSYPVFITDLPGEEQFSICQFDIGSAGCTTPPVYGPVPASLCSAGVCALPNAAVVGGKMTAFIVTYAPTTPAAVPPPASCSDGIDNDGDGVMDANDSDCGSNNPNPGERAPAPDVCDLTATPANLVLNIGTSKLAWKCTRGPVTISVISPAGSTFTTVTRSEAEGFINVAPDVTTTFKVVGGGGANDTAIVSVGTSEFDENGGL